MCVCVCVCVCLCIVCVHVCTCLCVCDKPNKPSQQLQRSAPRPCYAQGEASLQIGRRGPGRCRERCRGCATPSTRFGVCVRVCGLRPKQRRDRKAFLTFPKYCALICAGALYIYIYCAHLRRGLVHTGAHILRTTGLRHKCLIYSSPFNRESTVS